MAVGGAQEADDGWRCISIPLDTATPAWPGDTPYACGWTARIADGASVNLTQWTSSPHVGTHADAPLHVRDDGHGADRLPLEAYRGPAFVVDVREVPDQITPQRLEKLGVPRGVERLLLRTGRTVARGAFPESWPALSHEAADALTAGGLRLLGVDCPSVDARSSTALAVHRALFAAGAYVLENLDLHDVAAGPYELLALPLLTGPVDAAPVRALLRPYSSLP